MKFIFPLRSYITITQPFKGYGVHSGIDFGWNASVPNANGQQIVAAEAGTVISLADGYGNTWKKLPKTYGNYVIIDHGDSMFTVYGHLAKGLSVKRGQKVKKGDVIGRMGNSGYSNGQHLHFEIRKGGNVHKNVVDPLPYLRVEDKSIIISPNSMLRDEIKYRVVTTPVERDPKSDQIHVTGKYVNARASASTDSDSYGYIVPGYYNVSDVAKKKKYTWYNCGGEFWCAGVNGVEYLPKHEAVYNYTFLEVQESDIVSLDAVAVQLNCSTKVEEL